MHVHVAYTCAEEGSAHVGIVGDVVRATSWIAQALASGYETRLLLPRGGRSARARNLILSTTNGTAAILTAAERCDVVLIGSLLNLDAVCFAQMVGLPPRSSDRVRAGARGRRRSAGRDVPTSSSRTKD